MTEPTVVTLEHTGPEAFDIFPIVGKNKKGLIAAADKIRSTVLQDGGVSVYRIPEIGVEELCTEDGAKNGDITVMSKKRRPVSPLLKEVAVITGSPEEVLRSFRFIVKDGFKKSNLIVPPTITTEDLGDKASDGRLTPPTRNISASKSTTAGHDDLVVYSTDLEDIKITVMRAEVPDFVDPYKDFFTVRVAISPTSQDLKKALGVAAVDREYTIAGLLHTAACDHIAFTERKKKFDDERVTIEDTLMNMFRDLVDKKLDEDTALIVQSLLYDLSVLAYHEAADDFYVWPDNHLEDLTGGQKVSLSVNAENLASYYSKEHKSRSRRIKTEISDAIACIMWGDEIEEDDGFDDESGDVIIDVSDLDAPMVQEQGLHMLMAIVEGAPKGTCLNTIQTMGGLESILDSGGVLSFQGDIIFQDEIEIEDMGMGSTPGYCMVDSTEYYLSLEEVIVEALRMKTRLGITKTEIENYNMEALSLAATLAENLGLEDGPPDGLEVGETLVRFDHFTEEDPKDLGPVFRVKNYNGQDEIMHPLWFDDGDSMSIACWIPSSAVEHDLDVFYGRKGKQVKYTPKVAKMLTPVMPRVSEIRDVLENRASPIILEDVENDYSRLLDRIEAVAGLNIPEQEQLKRLEDMNDDLFVFRTLLGIEVT